MLTLISGQRRRITYFAVTTAIGLPLIGLLPGLRWYTQAVSFLLAPLAMAAVAAVLLAQAPARRGWLECIGTGVLLGALIGTLTGHGGLLGLPLALALSAALVLLLHGQWRARLPITVTLTSGTAGPVQADGAELWSALVPGAGPELVSDRLVELAPDPADRRGKRFRAGLMVCGELAEEVRLTLLETDSSGIARIHIAGESAEGLLSSTILTVTIIEVDPDCSRLALRETREAMHPGDAIERWFDDVLGGELRHLQAHFLALNPPDPERAPAEPAAEPTAAGGRAARAAARLRREAESRALPPGPPMPGLARLPDDHLTLAAVRQAVDTAPAARQTPPPAASGPRLQPVPDTRAAPAPPELQKAQQAPETPCSTRAPEEARKLEAMRKAFGR